MASKARRVKLPEVLPRRVSPFVITIVMLITLVAITVAVVVWRGGWQSWQP
jgi:hypothetical protein